MSIKIYYKDGKVEDIRDVEMIYYGSETLTIRHEEETSEVQMSDIRDFEVIAY